MGYPTYLELVKGRFYADSVSRFDHADVAPLFVKNVRIPLETMKRFGNTDQVISFVSDREGVFIANIRAAGAGNVIYYESFPIDEQGIHIADHFLKLLDRMSINSSFRMPKIFLSHDDVLSGSAFIKSRVADFQKTLVVVHPGSGSRQKCWPVERYAELIAWLNDKMNAQVIVVAGHADDDVIEKLRMKVKSVIVADRLPLPALAAVIKQCALFVGNDSGITHIAAALGIKTVAIFGPVDPDLWAPLGEQVKVIYKRLDCSPCLPDVRRDCCHQVCLEHVTVEDVISEIKSFNGHFQLP
jgi:ADP-heptose:LPS heptosyltransferase